MAIVIFSVSDRNPRVDSSILSLGTSAINVGCSLFNRPLFCEAKIAREFYQFWLISLNTHPAKPCPTKKAVALGKMNIEITR